MQSFNDAFTVYDNVPFMVRYNNIFMGLASWKLTGTVHFLRFASSMIYFAISLYPTYLSGDRLLNILYSGIAEVPAVVLAYLLPQYCGRVKSTSFLYVLCGFACAVSPFLKRGKFSIGLCKYMHFQKRKTFIVLVNATLVTVLILISKTTIAAAFDLIYVITSEVSPTLVRSTSLGVASMCARVGGIVMPFLMLAGWCVGLKAIIAHTFNL